MEKKIKSRYIEKNELSRVKKLSMKTDKLARDFLPLAVSLATGLRVGDVVKIRPTDIKGDGIEYIAEKTGKKGFAKCPRSLIAEMWKGASSEWVFPSPTKRGQHITRQAVWKRAKHFAKLANINADGFSPHSMRKVFAVETYKNHGAKAAQNALQHSRIDTTELYIFSDFSTGLNAEKPLLRRDIDMVVKMVVQAIISELRT